MSFRTIVTVGPAILNEEKLSQINVLGDCIYRINGAHADARAAGNIVAEVRRALKDVNIMIDLPGNKVRTANLTDPIRLKKGETFKLQKYEVNYSGFFDLLKKGDIILANDSAFTLEVLEVTAEYAKILSHSDGLLKTGKGLHSRGSNKDIPFLFERDISLIDAAITHGVQYLSLSYVRHADDIREVKRILGSKGADVKLIAKIETRSALDNLEEILDEVDSVNIDRGDLSTDIGLLNVPAAQKKVVATCLSRSKDVYLATQFLKNMENCPVPLIAEIDALHNAIESGISGIQLSEETAVGENAVECVKLVFDMVKVMDGESR